MPSTTYPERNALGNGAAGTRRCRNGRALRWRRQIELGLIAFAALIVPSVAGAEELPALIRATAPSLGIGDADSPTRRQLAQGRGELETQADQLFDQLLKDPKNVDLTLRYAEAAAKLGNYEAAISSLERLLLLDRNFPGVRLQLAELDYLATSHAAQSAFAENYVGLPPEPRFGRNGVGGQRQKQA